MARGHHGSTGVAAGRCFTTNARWRYGHVGVIANEASELASISPREAQVSVTRGDPSPPDVRDGRLADSRRRGYRKHVGTIAQQVSYLAGVSPRRNAGSMGDFVS